MVASCSIPPPLWCWCTTDGDRAESVMYAFCSCLVRVAGLGGTSSQPENDPCTIRHRDNTW